MKKPTPLKLVHAPAPETDAATALARTYYDEGALEHALGAMAIVAELKLDGEALSAALLAPAVRKDPKRLAEISDRCGTTVAELAAGVARMGQIRALSGAAPSS